MVSSLIAAGLGLFGYASIRFWQYGTRDAQKPFEERELCYVEERCEDRENPTNLRFARDTFLLIYTHAGDCIRLDCEPNTNQPRVVRDYEQVMPTVLFRKAGMNREVTVAEALEDFENFCRRREYNYRQYNSQVITRDMFNNLTDRKNFMTRNDFLMIILDKLNRPWDAFKINHLNTDYLFRRAYNRIYECLFREDKHPTVKLLERVYGEKLIERLKRHLHAKSFNLPDPFTKDEVENLLNAFGVDLWLDEMEHPDEE